MQVWAVGRAGLRLMVLIYILAEWAVISQWWAEWWGARKICVLGGSLEALCRVCT